MKTLSFISDSPQSQIQQDSTPQRPCRLSLAFLAAILLTIESTASPEQPPENPIPLPAPIHPIGVDAGSPHAASFVGAANCLGCHEKQARLWQGSHHDLAMQVANEQTVLGDFDDATFEQHGIVSKFFRQEGKFMVRTEGEDGALHDYAVRFVFGITPLQQYLVEFPGGRLQTLPLCWDTRPAEQGGQRWFHIYDQERINPDDVLFWTKISQNWNYMCAECHSTNLQKRYDPQADAYHTTWSEINVTCEACHGPGSEHVVWAAGKSSDQTYDIHDDKGLVVRLRDLSGGTWQFDPETRKPERSVPLQSRVQTETCGRCHSRRHLIHEPYRYGRSLHDTHVVDQLRAETYFPDGQIKDEVYVYGSFRQSKMYQAGVRCVDCHDPHSLELKRSGNALCLNCHVGDYHTTKHHFHTKPGPGQQCIDCHMAQRYYMVVDERADHSFRVPRPDLSLTLGVPNACNHCHTDRDARWAADRVEQWYGSRRNLPTHFGAVLHAARQGQPGADRLLIELLADSTQPAIVHGAALGTIQQRPSRDTVLAGLRSLNDPDPMVRLSAVDLLELLAPRERWRLGAGLLTDPVRAVRVQAARLLARNSAAYAGTHADDLAKAIAEYEAVQRLNADQAGSYINLGVLYEELGKNKAAEQAYRTAIQRDPRFGPAYVNLAELYRNQQQEAEAEKVLRQAVAADPNFATGHYALGMSLVRSQKLAAAIESLQAAARLEPENSQYVYAYAVGLNSTQQGERAIEVLTRALGQHPNDIQILSALTTFHRDRGEIKPAIRYAERLVRLLPNDPQARQLLQSLQTVGGDS